MAKHKNVIWDVMGIDVGQCQLAVLMDIRDELQGLNVEMKKLKALFRCDSFLQIPMILRTIRRNTARRRKKTK